MNKKGVWDSQLVKGIGVIIVIFILTYITVFMIYPSIRDSKTASKCPTDCEKTTICAANKMYMESLSCGVDEAEVKDYRCCLTPEQVTKVKTGTGGTGTGTGSSGTGTSGAGAIPGTGAGAGAGATASEGTNGGYLYLQWGSDETELLSAITSKTLTVGKTYTITIWSQGQKTNLCSVSFYDKSNSNSVEVESGTWFKSKIIKEDCNIPNKKTITITPTVDQAGKTYRLNIMLYKDGVAPTYGASARIDMTVEKIQPVITDTQDPAANTGSIHLLLNGFDQSLGSTLQRTCGVDNRDIVTIWEDMSAVSYCVFSADEYIENIKDGSGNSLGSGGLNCDIQNKNYVSIKYNSLADIDCKSTFSGTETSKTIHLNLDKLDASGKSLGSVTLFTIYLKKE